MKLEQKIKQLLIQAELDFEKEKLAIAQARARSPFTAIIDQESINALHLTAGKVNALKALVLYVEKEKENVVKKAWDTLFPRGSYEV